MFTAKEAFGLRFRPVEPNRIVRASNYRHKSPAGKTLSPRMRADRAGITWPAKASIISHQTACKHHTLRGLFALPSAVDKFATHSPHRVVWIIARLRMNNRTSLRDFFDARHRWDGDRRQEPARCVRSIHERKKL
jgi:hypothetical protein